MQTNEIMLQSSTAAGVQLIERLPDKYEVVSWSPTLDRIFHMFVPTSRYWVGAELSYLGFGWEGNSDTAQPYILFNLSAEI